MLKLELEKTGLNEKLYKNAKLQKKLKLAHENLHSMDKSSGTGWVELPSLTSKSDIQTIKDKAKEIQECANLFIVIGVGGAVNGIKAGINLLKKASHKTEMVFIGEDFNAKRIQEILEYSKNKEVFVNVISKSGETTETLVAFHFIEEFMKKKYKKGEYKKRIIVTTDHEKGTLRELSNKEGYYSIVFPRTIGGRYSIHSIVGLLPMAVAGINIERIISGAKVAEKEFENIENVAYQYAQTRYLLNSKKKKTIKIIASFDHRVSSLYDWEKQLFAESEGKNKKGLFISSLNYPTDLHSYGQFVGDGNKILFETILTIDKQNADLTLEKVKETSPLYKFNGITLNEISQATAEGVKTSHFEKGVPIIELEIEELNEEFFGYFTYFLMTTAAVSAYLFNVNPFDQPAVEDYKEKTRKILENKN